MLNIIEFPHLWLSDVVAEVKFWLLHFVLFLKPFRMLRVKFMYGKRWKPIYFGMTQLD